jgi:DNA-binding response OmpR family regulator
MYADYLRAQGLDVMEADTTDSALPLASQADVIVTGLLVPGSFDGIDLVRRLRAGLLTRAKGIVVLTACVTEQHRQAARSAGCDVFLPKPCLPDLLESQVRRLMATRGRRS